MGPGGNTKVELSRTGARTTAAPTTSLVDAVQGLTRAALTEGSVYEPTRNLPRDPLDTSPFGPLAPLFIQAINPPRTDTGRPEPRVWEYPQGFNLPGGGDRLIPWETLRAASTNVDIIRRCIEIRKDDVRALKTAWRISDEAIKAAQEAEPTKARDEIEAELRKQFAPDIERLTTFWRKPWITNGVRFGQWVAAVMEDHIALDAVAIYPVTTVGGDVVAFRVVDGSTIKLLINDLGERPQPPHPAFQQNIYGFPRGEFIADVVLDEDGNEITDSTMFSASQITYWRENFRTYTPYGYSQVEQALVSAALYLKRQGWMHAEYDEGSTPLTWLVPEGDKFVANQLSPVQRREYETAINDDLEGQTGSRHRIKVSYPGFQPVQMDSIDEQYKPDYDLFLLKLVSSHLGVTLDRLGFTEAKGLGATGQHERQAEVQDDSGVNPDAAMLSDLIMELSTNYLSCPPELCFEFVKDKVEDEAAKDGIMDARRKRGTATWNEDRKASGLTPLSIPEGDAPSMVTATGMVFLEGAIEQQAKMQELAANPPAPGGPGAPGGGRPGPGGSGGAGGSGPKPSGPKPSGPSSAPRNKAAAASEVAAYHRWVSKQAGKGVPARPFRFEHAEPDAFPVEMHDGRWMAFEGYEWRQDITKDWRSWNAEHPTHPRGPHGRFVKLGNLVDELQRTHGPLSEHHEAAFDEAVRRAHAGRHVRRGESGPTDELAARGLLEDVHGRPGKLGISEAGRQHFDRRMSEAAPMPAEHVPAGEPEPIAAPETQIERGRRVQAVAEAASEIEELVDNGGDPDTIRRRMQATARRHAADADLASLAASIEAADDTDEMRTIAREFAEQHGLNRVGASGANEAYDPHLHEVLPGARRPQRGEQVGVVRPGYTMEDDSPIARAVYGEGQAVPVRRALVAEPHAEEVKPSLAELAATTHGAIRPHARAHEDLAEGRRWAEERFGPDDTKWPDETRFYVAELMANSRGLASLEAEPDTEIGGPVDMGPVVPPTPKLSEREQFERDAAAVAAGMKPGPDRDKFIRDTLAVDEMQATHARVMGFLDEAIAARKADEARAATDPVFAEQLRERTARGLELLTGRKVDRATGEPTGAPTVIEGDVVSIEDARGQSPADRLRQAEIMYGSDRSKWPAHARRDAARMERLAARKPKAIEPAPTPESPASGGQVDDSSGSVEPMKLTPAQQSVILGAQARGGQVLEPATRQSTVESLRRAGLIDGFELTPAGREHAGRIQSAELTSAQLNLLRAYRDSTPSAAKRATLQPLLQRGFVRDGKITPEGRAYLDSTAGSDAKADANQYDEREPATPVTAPAKLPTRETTIPVRGRRAKLSDAGKTRVPTPRRKETPEERLSRVRAQNEADRLAYEAEQAAQPTAGKVEELAQSHGLKAIVISRDPLVVSLHAMEPFRDGKGQVSMQMGRTVMTYHAVGGWRTARGEQIAAADVEAVAAESAARFAPESGRRTLPEHPTGMLNDDFSVNPGKVREALLAATSREDAAAVIDRLGLKAPELRQLAKDLNITVRSSDSKAKVRDTIVALTAGRRLDSLAINPGPRGAPTTAPAPGRHPATPEGVLAAVDQIARDNGSDTGEWVSITDLRARLGGTRAEQDAAIMEAVRGKVIKIIPEENQKTLTAADRAAALDIGGEPHHVVKLRSDGGTTTHALVGKRVNIKPSAGSEAINGTVRSVVGDGPSATYEVDAVDQSGRRSTLYLVREDFTAKARNKAAGSEGDPKA